MTTKSGIGIAADESLLQQSAGRRLGSFGLAAYNALYWPYLLTSCIVLFFPALLLFLLTVPFDRRRRWLHRYTCWWGGHYLAWAPFAGVRVQGREHLRDVGPCIFVSNHQSMVDILAVFATNLRFLWVSKIENFYVPFLGWNMALNRYVPLKRGYLPSILRMVRTCLLRLGEGESLFVFPEGTRSPDGKLLAFYPGAFRLATRRGIPIVPVVIDGTQRILPKRSLRIQPERVKVRILEPLFPSACEMNWKRLRDTVRERMTASLSELETGREDVPGL
jgi:1-acyl-sn-glycerol-3-phosphate acyltransferase